MFGYHIPTIREFTAPFTNSADELMHVAVAHYYPSSPHRTPSASLAASPECKALSTPPA